MSLFKRCSLCATPVMLKNGTGKRRIAPRYVGDPGVWQCTDSEACFCARMRLLRDARHAPA